MNGPLDIEGKLIAGVACFRWVCPCGRKGVWLQSILTVNEKARRHVADIAIHPVRPSVTN